MCWTSHAKFWPKKPVMKVSGRKTVARIVSCSMVEFCRTPTLRLLDRDHRHVGLQHRAEQVALGGDLLLDQQQVVLDVAQIGLQLLGRGVRLTVATTPSSGWTAR